MPFLERTGSQALGVDIGEIVSVLGAPGSGKTRLGLELAFLAKPREGRILLDGAEQRKKKSIGDRSRAPRSVTMLVQNAEDQLFARTVYDDVAFAPRHLLLPDEEVARRVLAALEAVGLNPTEVRDRSPFALSGGERRRVALAGVLAMEPQALILDEPTANLDPRTRNEFLGLLEPLRAKTAIVWLTPRAREAALTDRIYLLREGVTVGIAGGDELFTDWRALSAAGIELPSIYELAAAVEKRGWALPAVASASGLEVAIVETWRSRQNDR